MQATDLKFPGGFTSAQTIRREVAHEISQLEISAAAGSPVSGDLAAFLLDAATKTPGYTAPAPPTPPATEAVVKNAEVITLGGGVKYTFTVAGSKITKIVAASVG